MDLQLGKYNIQVSYIIWPSDTSKSQLLFLGFGNPSAYPRLKFFAWLVLVGKLTTKTMELLGWCLGMPRHDVARHTPVVALSPTSQITVVSRNIVVVAFNG
jgi:hypothetical protein